MLFDGIEILEGSEVVNFTLPKGTTFPSSPDQGELFYKIDVKKPYIYVDTSWIEMSTGSSSGNSTGGVTIVASMSGVTGQEGDLVYSIADAKLFVHDGVSFVESFSTEKVYDIGITAPGDVTLGSTIVFFVAARSFTIPQNFIGSQAVIGTNTGDATFTIYKNGASIGTVSFTNSSTVGTFTSATSVNFIAGDTLSVDSPSDNSPSNLAITIKATI